MDRWTQAQIANQQAIEEAARQAQREAQEKMLAAAALERMERAKQQAEEAARQRQLAQEAHNRTQGFRDNWRLDSWPKMVLAGLRQDHL
jgi:hypothetical protein